MGHSHRNAHVLTVPVTDSSGVCAPVLAVQVGLVLDVALVSLMAPVAVIGGASRAAMATSGGLGLGFWGSGF